MTNINEDTQKIVDFSGAFPEIGEVKEELVKERKEFEVREIPNKLTT